MGSAHLPARLEGQLEFVATLEAKLLDQTFGQVRISDRGGSYVLVYDEGTPVRHINIATIAESGASFPRRA